MMFSLGLLAFSALTAQALARNWEEDAYEFKSFLHNLAFHDGLSPDPFSLRRESNPLQMMSALDMPVMQLSRKAKKRSAGLPKGWIDSRPHNKRERKLLKKQKTLLKRLGNNKRNRNGQYVSVSELRSAQSMDDMALLHFLVNEGEPNFKIMQDTSVKRPKNKARLPKAKPRNNNGAWESEIWNPGEISFMSLQNQPSEPKKHVKWLSSKDKKPLIPKNKNNIDSNNGTRNKITISVAIGLIAAAVFAILVQIIRLFRGKSSQSPSNRSSWRQSLMSANQASNAYGYERIALEIDEDEEAAQLLNK